MRRLSRMRRLSGMPGLPMWRRLPMCRWCCGMRRIMRGLLRIVGPLPLVLGLGAFRMACPQADISQADISLAGPENGSGQLLDFATALAPAI